MRVLIAGTGYSGQRLARVLRERGHEVVALARRPGPNSQIYDLDTPSGTLDAADVVVFLAPPAEGDPEPRLENLFAALPEGPKRLVLASTSGVYGNCDGRLIDETAPLQPTSERAKRRVIQEQTARLLAGDQTTLVILRISGIYGPDRLPLTPLAEGATVIAARDAYPGNRIHVDDLVRSMVAAIEHPAAEGCYNVADGNPESGTVFYQRVAELAGLPPPMTISREEARQQFTPRRYSFLADSRQLDNSRLTSELGVEIAYDDLDAGIRASLPAPD